MRPGQNNKRMRGRPTNNRRGPNPLTRSYESNGPDVKIRGNAHHVAEKYLQLARDAHTSGDPVAAENYLQHAEHYYRLIAAAQAAQLQAQNGRAPGEADLEEGEDDEDGGVLDRFASPSERAPPPVVYNAPQPAFAPQPPVSAPVQPYTYNDRQPYESDRPNPPDRNNFQPRPDRHQNRNQDRGPRPDRPYNDRPYGDRQEGPRELRGNEARAREFRPFRDPNAPREQPPLVQPEIQAPTALPSFITTAPRVSIGVEESESPAIAPVIATPEAEPIDAAARAEPAQDARFPRGRRRRLRSPYGFHAGAQDDEGQPPMPGPEETPVAE